MIRRILLAACMIVAAPAFAQTVEDEGVWLNATVMETRPSGFAWFAEIQPRFGNGAGQLQQLILRPAIGWRLSDAVTVYGGYAHVVLTRDGEQDRGENRLFAQISWTIGKVGRGTLSSRSRLERRSLSNGRDTGHRAREMLRFVHPFTVPEKTRLLLSAEGFWALDSTDWGARKGFDQLRSFAGVEVPVGGRNTLELGYLNQLIDDPGPRRRMNHVASAALFIRL